MGYGGIQAPWIILMGIPKCKLEDTKLINFLQVLNLHQKRMQNYFNRVVVFP